MDKLTSLLVVIDDPDANEILLDKAFMLARNFGARMDILLTDPTALRALEGRCGALGCAGLVNFVLHGSDEPLREVIRRRIASYPVDLVMSGRASPHAPASPLVPVMRVGSQRWHHEPRFAVAVDVADGDEDAVARAALHTAGMLSLACGASLDVLYSEREKDDDRLRMERAVHVARLAREFPVRNEGLRMLEGPPEVTLPAAISGQQYDVLVVGMDAEAGGLSPILPGLSTLLAASTSGDVLWVTAAERAPADVAVAPTRDALVDRAHP